MIKTTIATSVRSAVTDAINKIGSTVTITPYTDENMDGGYGGKVELDDTAVTTTAAPYNLLKNITIIKAGDTEYGDMKLALLSTVTFDISGTTKYKFTLNSEVYDMSGVERFQLQDTLIAWIATLSKRID